MQRRLSMWRRLASIVLLLGLAAPASAEWRRVETDNFIIVGELRADRIRDYAMELERFDRTLRYLTHQQNDFAPVKLRILVLSDADDVSEFGNGDYAGYYMPDIRGPFAVAPRRNAGSAGFEIERREILFYEYAHHFMARYLPARYPTWYREGLAQLYSTVEFESDGRVHVGRAARALANQLGMLERAGYWMPLRELLSNEYAYLMLGNGEDWLLAHRAMFDPQLGHELGDYLALVQQGSPGRQAYDRVFADRDPALDDQLREYLAGHRFPYIPMEIDLGPIAEPRITVMNDEDAALALLHNRTGDAMEADLQRALAEYPDDAQVYAERARFLVSKDNFAAARDAADHALALAPDNLDAHLYASQALIGLAGEDSDSPRWSEARDHALQANRIDPDNAFALVCYFLSWPDNATRPADALPALEQAFALIPQSPAIRVLLGRAYLDSSRFNEARQAVAMVADASGGGGLQAYAALVARLATEQLDFSHAREVAGQLRTEREQQRERLGEIVSIEFLSVDPRSRVNQSDMLWHARTPLFQNPGH